MELYKLKSTGEMVKRIQKALSVYPDGVFGPITEEAVKRFQRDHKLTPDGVVGAKTLVLLFPEVIGLKKSKRKITDIIVHCTATPEGKEYSVEQIRQMHKANGWSDIGYHYVVHLDGKVDKGRDVDIAGAHVENHNARSIGVVYIGGVKKDGKTPKDTRTEEQKVALLNLLMDLRKLYPDAKITGHNNWTNKKACPCFNAKDEYCGI